MVSISIEVTNLVNLIFLNFQLVARLKVKVFSAYPSRIYVGGQINTNVNKTFSVILFRKIVIYLKGNIGNQIEV